MVKLTRSICLLLFLLIATPAQTNSPTVGTATGATQSAIGAADSKKGLIVSTRLVTPFVTKEQGELTGFSIDLWRSISADIGLKSEFVVQSSLPDLLGSVKNGQADLGIAAISITAQRSADFEFSQPMFDAGMQILIPTQSANDSIFPSILAFIFSKNLLELVVIILLLIFIPANIIWFVERRHKDGLIGDKRYFPGIFKACWCAAGILGAQAEEMPKSTVGRLVALVWMFISILFVAYFTAAFTTSLTVQKLKGDIAGPNDLYGKRVATVTGSTSASYLKQQNIDTLEFNQIEEAVAALQQKRANAVVFDAPVLLYYSSHAGKGKYQVVGPVFRKENYGIIFPINSPYRKEVNASLLRLKENGSYQALYQKWFGHDSGISATSTSE